MKPRITLLAFAALTTTFCSCFGPKHYDVVVVGGGTSGTAAGIQAARMGVRTLVIEESEWLGGMLTSAGVSATDGNYKLRGGLWGEFRDSLEVWYGGPDSLKTGWVSGVMFEPSVGNRIFQDMAAREEALTVWFGSTADNFTRQDGVWTISVSRRGRQRDVTARVLIDATELGDVAAAVGVEHSIGMDSRHDTGEDIAPEEANGVIQDMTYVMILKDYGRDVTIERPEGYDPSPFACCCINDKCVDPKEGDRMWSPGMMITYGKLPNGKYMVNWPIEGNDYYVNMIEMSRAEREAAVSKAKNFSLCFLYFLQTELGFNTLGLADDEYPTPDLLPFIPYHRESRRTEGEVLFTVNHITAPYDQPQPLYRTAVGVGDYPVDHHHVRYPGWDTLPELHFYPVPSYGFPLGIMIPRGRDGLIVAEKSVSVTNLVNGSTRLQPVVLQIGQAAGILAALSVTQEREIREVAVRDVQNAVLDAGGYLLPYLDIPASDRRFKAMQRIGATGIIRGAGMNSGWENQTWFQADSTITYAELERGMIAVYPGMALNPEQVPEPVSALNLAPVIADIRRGSGDTVLAEMKEMWKDAGLTRFNTTRPLTRLECAVVIDSLLDPFNSVPVDLEGNFKRQ